MKMNKIGFIRVSNSALESFWFNNKWFIPVSASRNQTHNDVITYLCYCDKFRLLSEYEVIPTYELVFKRSDDGVVDLLSVKEDEQ
jgi:hypothetical protein